MRTAASRRVRVSRRELWLPHARARAREMSASARRFAAGVVRCIGARAVPRLSAALRPQHTAHRPSRPLPAAVIGYGLAGVKTFVRLWAGLRLPTSVEGLPHEYANLTTFRALSG